MSGAETFETRHPLEVHFSLARRTNSIVGYVVMQLAARAPMALPNKPRQVRHFARKQSAPRAG